MTETEQIKIDHMWTTDGFVGVPSEKRDTGGRTAVLDRVQPRETYHMEHCNMIELFPAVTATTGAAARTKKRSDFTAAEMLAIVLLTIAASTVLFAAIGYICQW